MRKTKRIQILSIKEELKNALKINLAKANNISILILKYYDIFTQTLINIFKNNSSKVLWDYSTS